MDDKQISTLFISEPAPEGYPQEGRRRMIIPSPVAIYGTKVGDVEASLFKHLSDDTVFMMGDNPALPKMPDKPKLMDFYKYRFDDFTGQHLMTSAYKAMEDGLKDEVVMACLLHDISNGCLIRPDHGYWGAQLIAPYVSEEIAWAVKYHQCLRYFADEENNYPYPESYNTFFGADFQPPEYLKKDAEYARNHKWYMTARLVTIYDTYFAENTEAIDPSVFDDLLERNFKQPAEGLGFDDSPTAHMWRTMIWPNNCL